MSLSIALEFGGLFDWDACGVREVDNRRVDLYVK